MVAVAALLGLAAPAVADKRVDDAVARAESQLQKGKPEEALKTMEKAVSQQPTSADAHAGLARVQARAGKLEEAVASARKATDLSASAEPAARAAAFSTLSGLEIVHGASGDAVAHAQEAVKAQESAATLSALAVAQARSRDAAAVATAERAVQMGASSAAAHAALGEAQLSAGRSQEAADAFRKALTLDPASTAARVGLASSLLAAGKAAEAEAEARKASDADPNSGEAFAVLGAAIYAKDTNQWGDAIAQAQQGAFLNPKNPMVQTAVGRLFDAAGNLDQAASAYKRALQADPRYGPARVALVQAQVRRGDPASALVEVQKLAQEMPNNAEVNLQLGELLLRKGDTVAAVEPLEKAVAGLPGNASAHAYLGRAYLFTGQRDDALGAYRKAVELAPKNLANRSTYGLLLGMNKQYDAGITELKKVVGSPGYKDTEGYTNLGWIYRNMEPSNAAEAVKAYKKALELDPKNAQAALGLGWSHSYEKQHDEGIAAFHKALVLDPKTAGEAYNGIAWAHFFKKDMTQAKASAEKAKAEGRNVTALLTNIDRFEKGQAAEAEAEAARSFRQEQRADEGGGMGEASRNLMKGAPAARRTAARELARHGSGAVPFLIYAAVNDRDFGVRQEALGALGSMGGAARGQCAQIKQIAAGNPYDQTVMEKEQMQRMVAYEDVRRAARAAAAKLGCN
jgi:tetratricopeptide (TPR) repeat protein